MDNAMRKLASGCVAAVSVGAVLLGAAAPAAAWGRDGSLENHEFGLFYWQNQSGCVFDLVTNDVNFNDDKYQGSCSAGGQWINDTTESYWNRDIYAWKVGTDKDLGGNVGEIPSSYRGNASATFKNKISSAKYTLHP
ncbi:hypothetical protein OG756_22980 [Streptomyces sp. NBC_01310]|uniref:hypothetical protein n=1 Tax=Streptomyces sp. NBC_01310 TaxID=2903820 RepID=UPI0035B615EC|nr:hypothetical protein OG756_22980 [Streptomyces sp. NBC_01310]